MMPQSMKLYYIVNARLPTEKAHGIQVAKMCAAFREVGVDLTLIASSRGEGSLEEWYGLTTAVPIVRLPVLDLQFLGRVGYWLTALEFMLGSYVYLWLQIIKGESFAVYTVDMDQFSFAPLAWLPRRVYAEMHSVKQSNLLSRSFFRRAHVIATNQLIRDGLEERFGIPEERLIVEPNGVDETLLSHARSQKEARAQLGLPVDRPFALYVGLMYAWKGLEILTEAAQTSALPIVVVGGSREAYHEVTGLSGEPLQFMGQRPPSEIPLWIAAADVLIVLGTARNQDSYRFTSPMKIFEYLASGRPTVASRTPALLSIMGEDTAFWYTPDDVAALRTALAEAHTSPRSRGVIQAGQALAREHTWKRRAKRIMEWIRV